MSPDLDRPWPRTWAWWWAWRSLFLEISNLLARSLLPAAAFAPSPRKHSLLRRHRLWALIKEVDNYRWIELDKYKWCLGLSAYLGVANTLDPQITQTISDIKSSFHGCFILYFHLRIFAMEILLWKIICYVQSTSSANMLVAMPYQWKEDNCWSCRIHSIVPAYIPG